MDGPTQPIDLSSSAPETPPMPRAPAGKRPRPNLSVLPYPHEEDPDTGDEEEDLLPYLADFFEDFGVPPRDRIGICRAYATYLDKVLRTQKKRK